VTWQPASAGLPGGDAVTALAIDPADPRTLYAAAAFGGGIFKTGDGGVSWTLISASFGFGGSLAVDPVTPGTLYVGGLLAFQGVLRSVDGGASWTPLTAGLTRQAVRALLVEPQRPTRVYAGTEGGGAFVIEQTTPSFDDDGRADVAVFRTSSGEWFIRRSSDGSLVTTAWGAAPLGDVPVAADYDGDGRGDIAVYRGSTGEWFVRRSSTGVGLQLAWGAPALGDQPVPADYDGDGAADVGVYRQATGEWLIRRSSDGGLTIIPWGAPALGDLPVVPR
jgi:hypothetical protein